MTEHPTLTDPFTEEQRLAIWRAFQQMPYGALLPNWSTARGPEHVTELLVVLGALTELLRGVAQEQDANDEALRRLRGQQAAVRDFLGLP